MKIREVQELRTKEPKELEAMAAKKKGELSSVLIDIKAGRTKNVHAARALKQDIAIIKTILSERRDK